MSDINDLRGTQVTIGKLVVEFPVAIPESDEDILDREETMEAVRNEIAEPAAVVKLGKDLIKALHGDVMETMRQRRLEEKTGIKQERLPLGEPEGKGGRKGKKKA